MSRSPGVGGGKSVVLLRHLVNSGACVVDQQLKPPTFYTRVQISVPATLPSIQLPARVSGKAAEASQSTRVPIVPVGDSNKMQGSWLQPGPVLVIVVIRRVNQ